MLRLRRLRPLWLRLRLWRGCLKLGGQRRCEDRLGRSWSGAGALAGAGVGDSDGGEETSLGVSTSPPVTRRLTPSAFLVMMKSWSLNEKYSVHVWLLTRCKGHLKLVNNKEESTWARLKGRARLKGPEITSEASLSGVGLPALLALPRRVWSPGRGLCVFLSKVCSSVFARATVSCISWSQERGRYDPKSNPWRNHGSSPGMICVTSVNSCPARLLRLASLLPDTVDVHHGEFVLALVEEFGVIVVYG